jgi:hypothetical protein
VNVMYAARLAEQGTAASVFAKPLPSVHRRGCSGRCRGSTSPAARSSRPSRVFRRACSRRRPAVAFAPRCPAREPRCVESLPELEEIEAGHHFGVPSRALSSRHEGPEVDRPGLGGGDASGAAQAPAGETTARSARAQDVVRREPRRAVRRSCGAAGRRRRFVRDPRGRDAGPRRRVGLRQDDRRPHAAAPRARDRREDRLRRHRRDERRAPRS